jgi:hypothetical protein
MDKKTDCDSRSFRPNTNIFCDIKHELKFACQSHPLASICRSHLTGIHDKKP